LIDPFRISCDPSDIAQSAVTSVVSVPTDTRDKTRAVVRATNFIVYFS
jgi:hypothetical protein